MMTLNVMRTPTFIAWNQHNIVGCWTQARSKPNWYWCARPHGHLHDPTQFACKTVTSHSRVLTPLYPRTQPPLCPEQTPFVIRGPSSLALWVECPPCPRPRRWCIEWREYALTSYPLPNLHEDSRSCYEVVSLMVPKTVTLWTQALLHHAK